MLKIRRIPNEDELLMYNYFKRLNKEILVVLTKSDKLSNNQKNNQIRKIKEFLNIEDKIIAFSSETLENKDYIWDYITDNVSRYVNE